MQLPAYITQALSCLESKGHSAYVVGGCVRDVLLGVSPHDWDLATSALPAQVAEAFTEGFEDAHILETGLRHGTLTILLPEGAVEVTTFRSEGEYLDNRRPAHVRFDVGAEEDFARRDFTMNALAFNPRTGLTDPFGGRRDIETRVIRAVGDPSERLREDALRIMRALRFAATLGFSLDERLADALHENRDLLARIAPERLSNELLRMLAGPHVLPVLLAYPDVLTVFVPEIGPAIGHEQNTPYHRYDVWAHTAHAVAAAKPDPLVRLALLMHDLGKPDCFTLDENGRAHFYGHDERGELLARERLAALRLSGDAQKQVTQLVRYHQRPLKPEGMLRWLNRLGEQQLRLLIEVKRGDIAAHADDVAHRGLERMDACEARLDELVAEQACFRLRDLAVGGDDLKAIGFTEGQELGRALAALLDAVMDGELQNDRDQLLTTAKSWSQT
ncbi:MAG: HD domain-containing protein [Coriobacteriales bacterium]|jgi:tRNA nucleotidyltransferase (CCA-adding enzyme)|nr:HD domain-containing protein [Coriobacteriales bacterium]